MKCTDDAFEHDAVSFVIIGKMKKKGKYNELAAGEISLQYLVLKLLTIVVSCPFTTFQPCLRQ